MPEETEQSSEQQDTGTEETVEETAAEEQDGTESTDDAQEADAGEERPFDRKQAEAKIRKANSEAANLRKRLKEQEPLVAELQRIKDAEKTDSERLNDQLAAAQAQVAKTRQRLVRSQVKALAGTATDDRAAFADPGAFGAQAALGEGPAPGGPAASCTGPHSGVRRQQDTPPHPRRRVLRVA
jgi:hypothetical protein